MPSLVTDYTRSTSILWKIPIEFRAKQNQTSCKVPLCLCARNKSLFVEGRQNLVWKCKFLCANRSSAFCSDTDAIKSKPALQTRQDRHKIFLSLFRTWLYLLLFPSYWLDAMTTWKTFIWRLSMSYNNNQISIPERGTQTKQEIKLFMRKVQFVLLLFSTNYLSCELLLDRL